MIESVRDQYERYPYPPIGLLALPRRGQGTSLSYELGMQLLSNKKPASHRGKRILVAGAGTLEALIVAQAHPLAREVVAVDLSGSAISRLRARTALARVRSLINPSLVLAPVKFVRADLHQWELGTFDYIIASNILHHVPDPALLLKRLSSWLVPDGILRMVTYPKSSRIWMRQTAAWLKLNGVTPGAQNPCRNARAVINRLPRNHPIFSCFDSHPETTTPTGIVDAYMNACENPLGPLEWQAACAQASLAWIGETQRETSTGGFLTDLLPATRILTPWQKLQILDDLLELCANPVIWLRKTEALPELEAGFPSDFRENLNYVKNRESSRTLDFSKDLRPEAVWEAIRFGGTHWIRLSSTVRWELAQGLRRAEALLGLAGVSLDQGLKSLRDHVGPRVSVPPTCRILPGLSIIDYNCAELLRTPEPWGNEDWNQLTTLLGGGSKWKLFDPVSRKPIPGDTLAAQAQWLQTRHGSGESWISPFHLTAG